MLGQRVITAVVLLALLVPALFAPQPWPFHLLTLLLIGAAGWEWGRLNQAGMAASLAMGVALALACVVALFAGWPQQPPKQVWWLAAVVWIVGAAVALRSGPSLWPQLPRLARQILGLAALWAAWLAMSHARSIGINFILSVFCLVWVADIAAYFGGRQFGKRKLAPSISPGKSWEGVYSGMAGVFVLTLAWRAMESRIDTDSLSLYGRLLDQLGLLGGLAALVLLTGFSVVGDLVESLVKRAAGAKDSSRLLPGHGGVLDRVDALLPVFPLALALLSI
ncbi:MAG TPA: phosphatidate cytidylyltransferase [Rubrivivax sp.]|nr:phosphatidate cytidylyltransferase [Rubrivivax sp.]